MDIAIIGMSARFPQADNMEEFYENLKKGRHSVRELSLDRMLNTSLSTKNNYSKLAYIEDIYSFDHHLFDISMGEAKYIDPHQRLLLEVVYETIENAGYNTSQLDGSETAVFVGNTNQEYYHLAEEFDPMLFTGNTNASTAGRIARQFNLLGNAMMVDTACSSSLVALHLACKELASNDAELAFVCGVKIALFPGETTDFTGVGVTSADGITKSFSSSANGTGGGEAVGCVLIKPLKKAIQDNDIIHAVIKATAVNQDANRSANLSAPSSIAQAEVIRKALKKANVDASTVTLIETHGTGTKIGDPIEFEGLKKAYEDDTDKKQYCAIGSLKSNIGHTDSAAGISSLIKAVLSLKHKEIFPSINFDDPNPMIDFVDSPFYISTKNTPWESKEVRRAGVSSFGISGTNCHVILEEAPQQKHQTTSSRQKKCFVGFSSRTSEGLLRNATVLKETLHKKKNLDIHEVAYTLNMGRNHYEFRAGFVVDSCDDLIDQLENFLNKEVIQHPPISINLWYVFSGNSKVPENILTKLSNKYKIFEEYHKKCLALAGKVDQNKQFKRFVLQYCLYKTMNNYGLASKKIMGTGQGKLVIQVLREELTLEVALAKVSTFVPEENSDLSKKLLAFLDKNSSKESTSVIEVGAEGEIVEVLERLIDDSHKCQLINLVSKDEEDLLLDLLNSVYTQGYEVHWEAFYKKNSLRRVELPSYQFEKTRCWILEKGEMPNLSQEGMGDNSMSIKLLTREQNLSWTDTENKVADCWYNVLQVENLSLEDNFFKMGGHSLLGVKLVNFISEIFKVKLHFRSVLEHPTIKDLANYLEQIGGNEEHVQLPIPLVEKGNSYELSHSQRRLWFLDKVEGVSNAYNISYAFKLIGDLKVDSFKASFDLLLSRHESLRTIFVNDNGEPRQIIVERSDISFQVNFIDLSVEKDKYEKVQTYVSATSSEPFDLERGPLIRATLIHLSKQEYVFAMTLHHIVSDGWSMSILIKEILQAYNTLSQGLSLRFPVLSVQYKDFANWQNGIIADKDSNIHKQYWHNKLKGEWSELNFPNRKLRPKIKTFSGGRVIKELSKEISSAFQTLSQENGSTIFMAFLAAIKALSYRYTGEEDIVIGTTVAGREHPDLEAQIGFYVNNLVLRTQVNGSGTFYELLKSVKETALEAYTHQLYPFDKLVNEIDIKRDPGRYPLFNIMVEFNEMGIAPGNDVDLNGINVESFESGVSLSRYDLTFRYYGQNTIQLELEYNKDLYTQSSAEHILDQLIELISSITTDKQTSLQALNYIPDREKIELAQLNETDVPIDSLQNVVTLFEHQVEETPEAEALTYEGLTMSYRELNERSNQLAHHLIEEYSVKSGTLIGLMLDRSENMVIALLGILKSGAAYVPIDSHYPVSRKKHILESSNIGLLITDSHHLSDIPFYEGSLFAIDIQLSQLENSLTNPDQVLDQKDLAYVLYTSGSTGSPKGCEIQHKSLTNYLLWSIDFYLGGDTKYGNFGLFTSLSFDFTITSIFSSLLVGKRLTIYPSNTETRIILKDIFDSKTKTDIVKLTPSHISLLPSVGLKSTNIKKVIVGGEELTKKQVSILRDIEQHIEIVNEYGPTEATVGCIVKVVEHEEDILIGRPIWNTQIHLLDVEDKPVGIGVKGEIGISGDSLSRGYQNDEDLTGQKFISVDTIRVYKTGDYGRWNSEGNIEFLGRKDNQFKIRGHRVEIGEIEHVLQQHPDIVASVVTEHEGDLSNMLICYFTSHISLKVNEMREFLSRSLPDYMVPGRFVRINQMPVTDNGKIDKELLSEESGEILRSSSEYISPRTGLENKLEQIWREILEIEEKIGVNDNFFEIGGDSIKIVEVFNRITKEYGALKITKLFNYPTIGLQANFINGSLGVDTGESEGKLKSVEF